MLDTNVIADMIQKQIATQIDAQVLAVLTADVWLESLEQKILQYSQDRILAKFASADGMSQILKAVKHSVVEIFDAGSIPGMQQFIDQDKIRHAVDSSVEQIIKASIDQFGQDPDWQRRVERIITQGVAEETQARLCATDLGPVIKSHVDAHMQQFTKKLMQNFTSTGIADQAVACELTILDQAVVVEHVLHADSAEIVDALRTQHLIVTGSINTDNVAWTALSDHVSQQTLEKLSTQWRDSLVQQVTTEIQQKGICFDHVKIGDTALVDGVKLSSAITQSSLQQVGKLKTLQVQGEAHINNNTVNVLNRRVGINTDTPEKALSVWDEEVSVVIGKNKLNQAYIGTNRDQGLVLGVNREPQVQIDTDGLTTVKQLRVGVHRISHDTQVPGWSGTRGDLVFNASPGADQVFAWVCLGAFRWQTLKSA